MWRYTLISLKKMKIEIYMYYKLKYVILIMRMLTFFRFMRQIMHKKPADLDWIQNQGLMAVKLAQIFALRPDLLGEEKCKQLQQLYQHLLLFHQKSGKKPSKSSDSKLLR